MGDAEMEEAGPGVGVSRGKRGDGALYMVFMEGDLRLEAAMASPEGRCLG